MIIDDNGDKEDLERRIREYMLRTAGIARGVSLVQATTADVNSTRENASELGLGFATTSALKYKKKADKDIF